MVTYNQLEAERWYREEIATDAMTWLGQALCDYFGLSHNYAGIKGDNAHLRGAHRSQNWIKNSEYCTDRSYTVQSGLSGEALNYLAGLDFNPDSEARMMLICGRLDTVVRAGLCEEVTEWYGNLNGDEVVDGYNNIANRIASSGSSHLWHLHLTLLRSLAASWALAQKLFGIFTGTIVVRGGALVDLTKGMTMAGVLFRDGTAATAEERAQVWLWDGGCFKRRIAAADVPVLLGLARVKDSEGRPMADLYNNEIQDYGNNGIFGIDVDTLKAAATTATLTADQVSALAGQISAAVIAADVPLGAADEPTIEKAVKDALRAGIGT